MTFHDPHFDQFQDFLGLEMKSSNSMTFQDFHDLYEPCVCKLQSSVTFTLYASEGYNKQFLRLIS